MKHKEWMAAGVAFLAAFALRVPFRSQYAYHWDSAQYALAIQHYDLRIGLPHGVGYFLYVMAGRLLNCLIGDPHASLVWLSVISGAALAALGCLLGTSLFGFRCGIATGVILATSPLCWFSSEIALNNILDSALVTATVWWAWCALRRRGTWVDTVGLAAMLAIVAGVRQQTAPILLPVWLFAFWRMGWRKTIVGVSLAGAFCLLWFVPMLKTSGGLETYRQLLHKRALLDSRLTPWGGGLSAMWGSAALIIASCWAGLLAAGLLAAVESVRCKTRRERLAGHRDQVWLLALWILPMAIFGVIMYTGRPDYVLSYFPAIAVLAGAGISRSWALSLVAAAVNIAVFLGYTGLALGLPVSATVIRQHDRTFGACVDSIRKRYRPEEVVICHANQSFSWGLRQFQYHLPSYENFLLKRDPALAPPFDSKLWSTTGATLRFVDQLPGGKTRLLIVPPGQNVGIFSNYFDITKAEMWQTPGCPPMFTIETP